MKKIISRESLKIISEMAKEIINESIGVAMKMKAWRHGVSKIAAA